VEKERGKHQETELSLRGNHNILKAQKVQLSLKHFRLTLVTSSILGIIFMIVFNSKDHKIILYRQWMKPDVVRRQTVDCIIEDSDLHYTAIVLLLKQEYGTKGKKPSKTEIDWAEKYLQEREKRPLCEIKEIIWTKGPAPPSLKKFYYIPASVSGFFVGYALQFSIMMLFWFTIAKVIPWIRKGFEAKSEIASD